MNNRGESPRNWSHDVFVTTLGALCDPALAIAASRAGATGLVDLSDVIAAPQALAAVERLVRLATGRYGLIVRAPLDELMQAALGRLEAADTIVLSGAARDVDASVVSFCRARARRVGLVVRHFHEAQHAAELGLDFVIAKGHESGGRVGEETTFILLQRLLAWGQLPVVAWGGIGWHSAAGCRAAGAAGLVFDWQLALTRESPLPDALRHRIARMDGTETVVVYGPDGENYRLYHRPGLTARDELQAADAGSWDATIRRLLVSERPEDRLLPIGQDAAFASEWAAKAPTVARALQLLEEQVQQHLRGSVAAPALRPDGPLAASHGTRYAIVQGPMTRVSDVPEFCAAVADNGALPVLALALMRHDEVRGLLERTRALLGDRPWGVGILGFAEREIRADQIRAMEEVRPPYAIIAGGRRDQAAALEARGIRTYLHVPTPGMLKMFLAEGARRFVFEGRECGGHVGPLSSFVLWNTMIRVLLEARLKSEQAQQVHVLFAGGIHDAVSGAIVCAMAQPLVERGMKVGVVVGTGYLFTEEIVRTGAVLENFQKVAIKADHTTLLVTGPGHAIRCAETDYVRVFDAERRRLEQAGRSHEEIREALEQANIGRLRIASKGLVRDSSEAQTGQRRLVQLDEAAQRREGIYMLGQVAALRSSRVSMRELHEDICVRSAELLGRVARQPLAAQARQRPRPEPFDIAIVGMACFVPGAQSVEEFWRNILTGRDCIEEVPRDRFDYRRWYDPDKTARDKIYGRHGGFIHDVAFDPLRFGIPPTTMRHVEPVHFLALELAYRALRDAGYHEYNPYRQRTGVILGVGAGAAEMSTRYAFRAMIPQFVQNPDESLWSQLPEWTEDSFAGILPNVVAGRITNRLNLGGPNYTVDAACAAGLAAVAQACRELTEGTADMVISGGADTAQNPLAFHCLSSTRALSPAGRTAAFDEAADGLVNSEGLTFFVLKRRADAERDGDRIYAIIRGVGASADGQTKGLTAPSADGQRRALQAAYDQAGFSPATVGLFEAHGTGTARGDVTECQSLMSLLNEHGARPQTAALGSAKSNVGHTKCNAGAVGLMKAALSLYHRVLPPTIHVKRPNPKANLDESAPVYLNTELRPWIRGRHPRRAGVFAAGFGGTNFHAVLEEHTGDPVSRHKLAPDRRRAAEIFVFSAGTQAELAAAARKLLGELTAAMQSGAEFELADLAYTLHRREPRPWGAQRAVVVATSADELATRLKELAETLNVEGATPARPQAGSAQIRPGVYFTSQPIGTSGGVALLFPGQGSQHPNMFRDLALDFAEVAQRFELVDEVLEGLTQRPLSRYVFPPPAFTDAQRQRAFEELKATEIAQPALGACGAAALRLLEAFGLRPDMTAGHSYGELVALYAAGAMDERTLYRLSWERAQSMLSVASSANGSPHDLGQMLAVRAGEATVRNVLNGLKDVWVANCNSPMQTVISGTRDALAAARQAMEAAGLTCVPVPVACAFHSPIMNPARERFAAVLAQTDLRRPQLSVFSNVHAALYGSEPDEIRGLLAEQLTSEVRFAAQIQAMYTAGARVFIEAGPGNVLTRLVREGLADRPHVAVAIQSKDAHGVVQFAHALAELIAHGLATDLERWYEGRALQTIDLAALARTGRRQYPPHYWFVNGGYARPVTEPPRDPQPRARLVSNEALASAATGGAPTADRADPIPPTTEGVPGQSRAAPEMPARPADLLTPRPLAPVATTPVTTENSRVKMSDAANVYAEFQETMRRFLETQKAVMEAYLRGAPVSAAAAEAVGGATAHVEPPRAQTASAPQRAPMPPEATVAPALAEQEPAAPTPAVDARPAAPASRPAVDLRQALLETVAQRTGYPPDMLDLNANLEAELGIDSIKRVEIIGALRRQVLPELSEPPAWFMERMTSVKSLQEILDGIAELVAKSSGAPGAVAAPPAAPAPAEQEPAAPTPAVDARPAAPASRPAVDLRQALLETVAQRTGYPPDMLDLNANLEAELGIDSIKRVEIIGALRRQVLPELSEPPAWFMERMTSVKSLQEILDGVAELVGERSGTEQAKPQTPEAGAPVAMSEKAAPERAGAPATGVERTPRCVPVAVEMPLGDSERRVPAGAFILTDDGRGVARALETAWRARGGQAVLLGPKALASRKAAAEAVERIRQQTGRLAGVLHMRALQEAPPLPEIDDARWDRLSDEELKGTLFLLQAVAPELSASHAEQPFFFGCLTIGAGDFDDTAAGEATHPWRGGLAGLLKCAAKEWPGARFRAVDLDDLPDGAMPDLLLREFHAAGPVEVGYREGRRLGLHIARADFDPHAPLGEPLLSRGSVVLVTGGARGITAAVAQELAERIRPILVLVGRSPLPQDREDPDTAELVDSGALRRFLLERARRAGRRSTPAQIEQALRALLAEREIRANLAALRAAGAKVEYHCCDVRDTAAFERLVRHVRQHHGRIDAVIHGAGIIEDKYIVDKSAESFDRVVSTKVTPLRTLCHVLDPAETKLLMLFSSVAGALGNPGQGDYAAANEILNRVARRLRSLWPGRVVAMNWGAWSGAGMVTPEVARQFAQRGIGMVTVAAGRQAAWDEIALDGGRAVRVLIGPGPWVDEADRSGAALRVETPLLAGQPVYRRSADVLEATVTLDPSRLAYLSDHAIEGRPVLPLTVAMGMMAELAAAGQPGMHLERITDVRQLAGVIVDGPRREVLLRAECIDSTTETAEWRVRLVDPAQPARPLYQVMVHLNVRPAARPAAPALDPIPNPFPLSVQEAYERWLFHGPAFRVIERLEGVAELGIEATIRPACQRRCVGAHVRRGWLIDPIALDAAPHMASLWSRAMFGTTQLPSRLAVYECYGPLGEGSLRVVMRSRMQSDGTAYNFDAWFIRDGQVLGRMQGLEGSGDEALNRITQGVP